MKTFEEYQNSLGRCPCCDSSEIETEGQIQGDGGTAWQEVVCLKCNAAWKDIYELVWYEKENN